MERLFELEKDGWWIQVQPLASQRKWICGIYKKSGSYWITQSCNSEFTTAKEAYDWAFKIIDETNAELHEKGLL
tara:strand:+ start:14525 stop:14746 length:222 start_codon:yes stop_codon:yes gene_type:complete